jgi:DNA-binding transcriptional regulator YhcF (GntR family)
MTTRARKLREEARQALYNTPNDQECEVPIMVATLRALVKELKYIGITEKNILELCDELEALK